MRRLNCVLAVLIPLASSAQLAEPLIFREKTHDFGSIEEVKGNVDHEFVFTNRTSRPVRIVTVTPSCGCTTPGWTKEPVSPGKTGFVKVSFDPRGRPGYFNKSLNVVIDAEPTTVVLQIKGNVTRNVPSGGNEFPVAMGSLRLKSKTFAMGTVYLNLDEPAFKVFPVMNGGEKPLKLLTAQRPTYVTIDLPVDPIEPGQEGFIKIHYSAKERGSFGFANDNITITTDDAVDPVKSISLFATLEEFYPTPTAEELLTAPQALLKETSLDFGQFPSGTSLERRVTLINKGKKELKIRAIQGNCPCISAEAIKQSLRPGDSTQIRILFNPQTRGGTQQKAITVYTNDPRNPVQLVSVSAVVN
jgi:hypothetical protein